MKWKTFPKPKPFKPKVHYPRAINVIEKNVKGKAFHIPESRMLVFGRLNRRLKGHEDCVICQQVQNDAKH